MGITFDIIDNDDLKFDRTFLLEVKNKIILDKLIEYIDNTDDLIGDEEAYLIRKYFTSFCNKFLNQNQMEKIYNLLGDSNEKIMKYELYSLLILLSKASFEAKIHTIFNLFTINDETYLKSCDFILLIKSVLNSVYKICRVQVPPDNKYIEFLKSKCPACLYNEDFEYVKCFN